MSIGVILCTYKRTSVLEEQVKAIREQTLTPTKIIVWRNDREDDSLFNQLKLQYVKASSNFGVWNRFSLCRDLMTKYVAVIDDDTIPGQKWFQKCVELVKSTDDKSLVCSNGFIFRGQDRFTESNFHNRTQVGWFSPKDETIAVDWPGHSWFFSQRVIEKMWSTPRVDTNTAGEDAHMAYSTQLIGGQCLCSPYGKDKDYWGSLRGRQGDDKHATHRTQGQRQNMIKALNYYRSLGWAFLEDAK